MDVEALKAAFQRVLERELMGITQIDVDLCEDGETVMLHGWTDDPEVYYIASFACPAVNWQRGGYEGVGMPPPPDRRGDRSFAKP